MKTNTDYILWAEKLKAIAHPVRLVILHRLMRGSFTPQDIMDEFEISQPAVSQHIAVMRRLGIIRCKKKGIMMCYGIVDPAITEVLQVVLTEKGG